jgi:hypothetical protein
MSLLSITFDIKTKIHTEDDLRWNISTLHCVSAIRKILYDTVNIIVPPCYVWELPDMLCTKFWYQIRKTEEIINWDIIFLKKYPKTRISHVALWLKNNEIFHSCRSWGTQLRSFVNLFPEYSFSEELSVTLWDIFPYLQ